MVAVAVLLQLLILLGALYDTAHLLTPDRSHWLPRDRRLRSRRAALETDEKRLVGQLLHRQIDPVTYRATMRSLADGQRAPRRGHRR